MTTYRTAYIISPKPGSSLADRYGKFVVEMLEDAQQNNTQQLQAAKRRFIEVAAGDDDEEEATEPEWNLKNFDTYWDIEEAEEIFHPDESLSNEDEDDEG